AMIHLKNKNREVDTYTLHDDFQIAAFSKQDLYRNELLDENGYITFKGTSFTSLDEYTAAVENGVSTTPIYATTFEDYYALTQNILMYSFRAQILSHVSFALLDHDSQRVIPTLVRTNHVIVP